MRQCLAACLAAVMAGACGAADTHQATFNTVQITVPAPPKEVERKIEISDKVHFHTSSARLEDRSDDVLAEVLAVLEDNPEMMIEIRGHTDSRGNDERNKQLSADRATAVLAHLVELGIDERRLIVVGRGEEQPIADNETSEGREQNRRVEFVILDERFTAERTASNGVDL